MRTGAIVFPSSKTVGCLLGCNPAIQRDTKHDRCATAGHRTSAALMQQLQPGCARLQFNRNRRVGRSMAETDQIIFAALARPKHANGRNRADQSHRMTLNADFYFSRVAVASRP